MARYTRKTLINDAKDAGLQVTEAAGRTYIQKTGRGATSIYISENGQIIRGDVRFDLATPMSVTVAARHLGLK